MCCVNTLGKGAMYSMSTKRINTKSSSEAALVDVDDRMPMVLCTRHYLMAQGNNLGHNVV